MTRSRRSHRSEPVVVVKQQGGFNSLLVLALVGTVLYFAFVKQDGRVLPPKPDDTIVNPDDGKKDEQNTAPVVLKDSWLVVVIERNSIPAKQQLVLNNKFWQSLQDRGMRFTVLDPDSDEGKLYAAISRIPPPFIAHELPSKELRKVIAFPDSVDSIEAMLK